MLKAATQASATRASPNRSARGVPDTHGTYALLLQCVRSGRVAVGSLGVMDVEPGVYIYLGSAFGPGGLRARLSRHAARRKVKRWHVDYLRPRMSLGGAWFSTSSHHQEHDWAASVLALENGTVPLPRFGASDCSCSSHLVYFPDRAAGSRSIADALGACAADSLVRVDAGLLRQLARGRR
ncbi:MAG: GIY-YIG nuclease family protein [Deltaproteobacteria bacterium]|nr:GIY-YIG nuclease family protein [Deltaproteobacteria bacterium]